MDLVIAGGTAAVPGFVEKFKECLEREGAPIPIGSVTLAKDPLRTVAKGALVAAVSMEKKKRKQSGEEPVPANKSTTPPPAPAEDVELPDMLDVEAGV